MKKSVLFLLAAFSLSAVNAQAPEDFQRDTISMGESYTESVFFSLDTKQKWELENDAWDIAFRGEPMTVGAYLNQATKLWDLTQMFVENSSSTTTAEEYFMTDLTQDFDDILSSSSLEDYQFFNSVTTWDTGAFNQWSPDDPQINFNLGWGMYDMGSHKIVGHKVFVINKAPAWPGAPVDPTAPQYKIYFKEHDPMSSDRPWEFWYAPLNATDEADITKITFNGSDYGDKLMVYFSFENGGEFLDLEPKASDWEVLFTRYKDLVTQGPTTMWYAVTGVQLNKFIPAYGLLDTEADLEEIDLEDDVVFDFIEWGDESIEMTNTNINAIGRDWRGSNVEDEYQIVPNNYFVQSKSNKVYQMRFRRAALGGAAPEGLAPGDIVIEYKLVEDNVNISEWKNDFEFTVYPNPTMDFVNINLNNNSLNNQDAQIVVTDLTGRHIMNQSAKVNTGQQSYTLDMSHLNAGIYMVYIQLDKGLLAQKVVKK